MVAQLKTAADFERFFKILFCEVLENHVLPEEKCICTFAYCGRCDSIVTFERLPHLPEALRDRCGLCYGPTAPASPQREKQLNKLHDFGKQRGFFIQAMKDFLNRPKELPSQREVQDIGHILTQALELTAGG